VTHYLFAGPTSRLFEPPTELFDFAPSTTAISRVAVPARLKRDLDQIPAFVTRMLVLPTGGVVLADSDTLWSAEAGETGAGDPD
jgi:hypothetical protein